MTDRPRDGEPGEGTPDYHWLYGGSDAADAGRREPRPDETRVMPTMPRPARSPDPNQGGPGTGGPGTGGSGTGGPGRGRPGGPSAPRAPRRRRPRVRWVVRGVLVLVLVWLVFLVYVPFHSWSQVNDVRFEPKGERPAEQPGTTYLMVGSDSRKGLTKAQRREYATGDVARDAGRTDTIMLLHTGAGPNLLMSLPRDSLVDVPGHGVGKINAAFARGGPRLLVQTIEQNTGIRIDKYVEVGLGGVVQMVDAVGGIEICPTFDMVDKLAGLNIKKGCQEANGPTALGYARSRHTDPRYGDITRAKHQREVVSAVGSEVLSPVTFINPLRYWDVWMAVPDSFRFGKGMSKLDAARWALAMTKVNGEDGMTCGVPIADLAVHWDATRSEQMFEYIKRDRTGDIPKSLCTPTGLPKSVTG